MGLILRMPECSWHSIRFFNHRKTIKQTKVLTTLCIIFKLLGNGPFFYGHIGFIHTSASVVRLISDRSDQIYRCKLEKNENIKIVFDFLPVQKSLPPSLTICLDAFGSPFPSFYLLSISLRLSPIRYCCRYYSLDSFFASIPFKCNAQNINKHIQVTWNKAHAFNTVHFSYWYISCQFYSD